MTALPILFLLILVPVLGSRLCSQVFMSGVNRHGVFRTPNVPSMHLRNMSCAFRFIGGPNEVVCIEWEAFDLNERTSCFENYMNVIVNQKFKSNVIYHYPRCGQMRRSPNFHIMHQGANIVFSSDSYNNNTGLYGTYKFITKKANEPPICWNYPINETIGIAKVDDVCNNTLAPSELRSGGRCSNSSATGFYFDISDKGCKRLTNDICRKTDHSFSSYSECVYYCLELSYRNYRPSLRTRCAEPLDRGNWCTKMMIRFYFDTEENRCKGLHYTGCGTSRNNFKSMIECVSECMSAPYPPEPSGLALQQNETSRCAEPADSGSWCTNLKLRFYFTVKNRCRGFDYTGCGTSRNNFESEDECVSECMSAPDPPQPSAVALQQNETSRCTEPLDRGNWCANMMFRHYFDTVENRCKGFHYTGCGTSRNNFKSEDECVTECMHQQAEEDQSFYNRSHILYYDDQEIHGPPELINRNQCVAYYFNSTISAHRALEYAMCKRGTDGKPSCFSARRLSVTAGRNRCKMSRWRSQCVGCFMLFRKIGGVGDELSINVFPLGLVDCNIDLSECINYTGSRL